MNNTVIMLNQHIKMVTFYVVILLEGHSYSLYNNHRTLGIPTAKFGYPVFKSKSTTSDYNLTLTFSIVHM